jgi:hypothetical protein
MKNKIKYIAANAGALIIAAAPTASANPGRESFFSASSIFHLALLICAVFCLLWGLKVLSLVRGGLLSRGWQMFVLGFATLVLAQVLVVFGKAHVLAMPEFVAVLLYLVMAAVWLAGLYQIQKALT